jgi:hypothetical protein
LIVFDFHKKRRRHRRRNLPFTPPLPGLNAVSGQRRSDPDYWREKREIEEAGFEDELAEILKIRALPESEIKSA